MPTLKEIYKEYNKTRTNDFNAHCVKVIKSVIKESQFIFMDDDTAEILIGYKFHLFYPYCIVRVIYNHNNKIIKIYEMGTANDMNDDVLIDAEKRPDVYANMSQALREYVLEAPGRNY
jgi:hypothetical protein